VPASGTYFFDIRRHPVAAPPAADLFALLKVDRVAERQVVVAFDEDLCARVYRNKVSAITAMISIAGTTIGGTNHAGILIPPKGGKKARPEASLHFEWLCSSTSAARSACRS
jgi:hypothetical protein